MAREKPQRIADELRSAILSGEVADGELLGREPELVERFGVSRPSLREALRILEAEQLITVVRGVRGGVVVNAPDSRVTARTAAMVLQARNVSIADVLEARHLLEPLAVRAIASMRNRKRVINDLRAMVDEVEAKIEDAEDFSLAFARFDEELVVLAGNQTLAIVDEMLSEIVSRTVAAVRRAREVDTPLAYRRRGVRSLRRLLDLLDDGDAVAAEEHWRRHLAEVSQASIGDNASALVDMVHHDT
jgi:GntR family transcriptional regulator, transcriptional repressor for pyruvate dehydrogenase complex